MSSSLRISGLLSSSPNDQRCTAGEHPTAGSSLSGSGGRNPGLVRFCSERPRMTEVHRHTTVYGSVQQVTVCRCLLRSMRETQWFWPGSARTVKNGQNGHNCRWSNVCTTGSSRWCTGRCTAGQAAETHSLVQFLAELYGLVSSRRCTAGSGQCTADVRRGTAGVRAGLYGGVQQVYGRSSVPVPAVHQ